MTLDEAIAHAKEKAKEIRKANEEMPTDCKLSEELCECAEEHEQLAEWLTELAERRDADRWIPVSERLPEEYGNYLVLLKYGTSGDIDIGTYHPRNFAKVWSLCDADGFYWADNKNIEVLAWKPLPKPYESEAENEQD